MTQPTSHVPTLAPTLFDWDDTRKYDQKGEVLSGRVRDKKTQEVYGILKYNDEGIRGVFASLSGFQAPFMTALRLPKRISDLNIAKVIERVYTCAYYDWLADNSKRSQAGSAPSHLSLYFKVARYTVWEIAKEIVKIATYPIAMIALEFCALYGFFINPVDGRKMWSTVEYLWSVSKPAETLTQWNPLNDNIGFLAPCMQPESVWEERSLFRALSKQYHPGTLRSILLMLKRQIAKQKQFLEEEGVDVKTLLGRIRTYHTLKIEYWGQIRTYFETNVSSSDESEFHSSGELLHMLYHKKHAAALNNMIADIDCLSEARVKIMEAQNAIANSFEGPFKKAQRKIIANAEDLRSQALNRLSSPCSYWGFFLPNYMHKAMHCTDSSHFTLRNYIAQIRLLGSSITDATTAEQETIKTVKSFLDSYEHCAPNDGTSFPRLRSVSPSSEAEISNFDGAYKARSYFQGQHAWALHLLLNDTKNYIEKRNKIASLKAALATCHPIEAITYRKELVEAEHIQSYLLSILSQPHLYWKK